MSESVVNILLYVTYALILIAVIGAIGSSLLGMFQNQEKAKKSLLSIGAVILIFVLCYVISGNEVLPAYEPFDVDAGKSKLIGAGLTATYTLGILAIGGAIFSEISRSFK